MNHKGDKPVPIATNNLIVSHLPADVRARFDGVARRLSLQAGHVLARPGERFASACFLESGLAAIGWGSSARSPDVALVGREGVIGHSLALGVDSASGPMVMRVEGTALTVSTADFRDLLNHADFRRAMLTYANELTNQIAECAYANATLPVLGRVARFLLLVAERLGSLDLAFTHDAIALALGCRRAGVTISIHILEGEGAIKARRNRITILDRRKLMATIADALPDFRTGAGAGIAATAPHPSQPPVAAQGGELIAGALPSQPAR